MSQLPYRARGVLLVIPALLLLAAVSRGQAAGRKYVIFQQWGGPAVSDAVRHARQLESLPFDGMTVTIPESGTLMLGGPTSAEQMRGELAPMRGAFTRFTQNFVVIHTRRPPDVFDDWSTLIQSWRNMARAARAAGLVGIFFDNEEYKEKTWTFPQDIRYPGKGLSAYHQQMRLRGRQVMQAVAAEFPNAVVLTFHGPYISDPRTPDAVTRSQCGARSQDLRGSFFVGMVEGAGPGITVVDGGENYQYRSAADFDQSYRWRKYETAGSAIVPAGLRKSWGSRVSIAFATFNKQWLAPYPMNPGIMRSTLANAIRRADKYVWFYEEGEWLKDGVPPDWAAAIREGIAAGGGTAGTSRPVARRQTPRPRTTAKKRPGATRRGGDDPVQDLLEKVKARARDEWGVDVNWLNGS